jgi:hypothetical protein
MTLSPHTQFFGSLVDASVELDLLKEYVLHMDTSLQEAETACQSSVQKMVSPSLECIAHDKSDLLAEPFPRLLHAGLIISTIIFLEQELHFLADSMRKTEELGLSIKDLQGSLIEKFRKYCVHVAQLPFAVSDQNWEDIRGIWEIRNCLVHSDGLLDGFGNASTVKAFASRHGTPQIEADRLVVDADTSLKVLEVVKAFVESVHEGFLQKYPKE